MTHLDLFSGIGGFALAAKWAGFETVAFCEIDNFACKVLNKNFLGVPVHRDIRELDGSLYAGIDLITGGYPCQPFSTAGKRKGTDDHRHLWPEMLRVIRQAKPAWVVCENVAGHITCGLDEVWDDLEGEGYACQPIVIPACSVEAPHIRSRVWIIANGSGATCKRYSRNVYTEEKECSGEGVKNGVDTIGLTTSGGERGTRYAGTWLPKPSLARLVHGLPNRMDRNRTLGNAIVPQVAYEILRCISSV